MPQSTQPAPTAPAAAPTTPQVAPPAANITRTDGVIGGTTAAPTTGTPTQGGTASTQEPAPVNAAPAQNGMSMMLMMAVIMGGFILMMFLSKRKEDKKRTELMSSLQRNDKVQTIGGMIGNIVEIDSNEVVLRTDEITNSRVRINRSAISAVLNRGDKAATKA